MACGGRVYKGDTVTISVPFDVDDYSNLKITYTTTGDSKIEKTQQEVEIEDGFITYTFEPGELDLLPDGVIYYTIECDVNGVPNVDSTNTNLYLKTPAGYSGRTAEDIYQEGYEAGLEDCSGSTDCSSAITEAYESGITEGIAQQKALLVSSAFTRNGTYTRENGWNEIEVNVPYFLPAEEKTLRLVQHVPGPWEVVASYPTIGMSKVTVEDDGYGSWKYDQGYQAGIAQCTGSTDCSSAITEAYQSGITYQKSLLSAITITANGSYYRPDGYESVNVEVEGTPQLEVRSYNLDENWNGDSGEIYPTTQLGFVGFRYFQVIDIGYGQAKYDDGYADGHTSGYTEGYNEAITANCGSAITEAYSSGVTAGEEEAKGSIFSVEIKFGISGLVESGYVSQVGYPPLYIIDTDGNSHQLNYIYSESPKKVHHIVDTTDEGGGTNIVTEQWAGYLQDGARYITPHQVIMYTAESNTDTGKTIVGQSIRFNGEVIHNWQTGPYGDVYDDWGIGDGGWKFATTDTEIGDLYIDTSYHNVRFKGLIFTI